MLPPIVIEGPNGSGKTTIADQLAQATGLPIIKYRNTGHTDKNAMVKYVAAGPFIWDRYHLTPWLYGERLRGQSEMTKLDLWCFEGLLTNYQAFQIICLPRGGHTMLRPRTPFPWPEKLQDLYNAFYDAGVSSAVTTWFYSMDSEDSIVRTIRAYTEHAERRAKSELQFFVPGMYGSHNPEVLIVGDERRHPDPLSDFMPFWGDQVKDTSLISSTLLMRAMKELKLGWKKTALINSKSFGEVVALDNLYEKLGKPKVVALGGVASDRLNNAGVPFRTIPHPQWWRRFRYHDEVGYKEKLREAIQA